MDSALEYPNNVLKSVIGSSSITELTNLSAALIYDLGSFLPLIKLPIIETIEPPLPKLPAKLK